MNYLASHLPKGEKIYAKTHKSVFIFMRDVLIAVLLFGITVGVQLGFKVDTKIMIWVYIVCAVVVVFCLCDSAVRYASTLLVVTTHKFMYKEDIITIKVFDTQLQNIDSVEVDYKTPLRRALNIGDLTLRTRNSVHVFTKPVPSRPFQRSAQQTRVGRAGRQDRKDLHLVCNRQIARPLR
ncbi:MAG: hypothetical protein L6V85_01085 [Clostridiales bacterium]|nr:MAG: hypothetical protein L6V85_01085 [Clostridiales bacterium]